MAHSRKPGFLTRKPLMFGNPRLLSPRDIMEESGDIGQWQIVVSFDHSSQSVSKKIVRKCYFASLPHSGHPVDGLALSLDLSSIFLHSHLHWTGLQVSGLSSALLEQFCCSHNMRMGEKSQGE